MDSWLTALLKSNIRAKRSAIFSGGSFLKLFMDCQFLACVCILLTGISDSRYEMKGNEPRIMRAGLIFRGMDSLFCIVFVIYFVRCSGWRLSGYMMHSSACGSLVRCRYFYLCKWVCKWKWMFMFVSYRRLFYLLPCDFVIYGTQG